MPKARYRAKFGDAGLYVNVIVSVEFPKELAAAAGVAGINKEEQENICNQTLAELIQLLGNEDEV